MPEVLTLRKLVKRVLFPGANGSAIVVAMVSVAILSIAASAFILMVTSEIESVNSIVMTQKALYVAESGIENVLYQRSKKPGDMCFPYYYHDSSEWKTSSQIIDNIELITGAPSGGIDSAPVGTCDPTVDSIPETTSTDELPCWPYNERLYANHLTFPASAPNDGYICNDGSDSSCPNYKPLLYWPAKGDRSGPGWKDMDDSIIGPLDPLTGKKGTGARFSTGLFTICNDDFKGIQPGNDAWDMACLEARAGGECPRHVFGLNIVSVGEVQVGKKTVRRAVKVDMLPPAMFSGVIDKYVDMTMTYQTDINGPIHINGFWSSNRWYAFVLSLSLSPAALVTWIDPPELVSVSFPEDPHNPDWQPSSLLGGITFSHDLLWIHLPVRLDIPKVNWGKWEDRMQELYDQAYQEYQDNPDKVMALRRCKYALQSYGDYRDYWNTSGDCGEAGEQYPYDSGGSKSDDKMDSALPNFMSSMSPAASPYNTGPGRIHNLQRRTSDAEVWGASSKYLFDLFDHWGYNASGDWVEGPENKAAYQYEVSSHSAGDSPLDRSLRYKRRFILEPDMGLGCLTCVISNGVNMDSFIFCCLGKELNRNEFWFMGKHEFRDFVYIDGVIGVGYRTPYHTCGGGDGGLGVYCVVVPEICIFSLCIPSWKFGLPHWHMGTATIKGEVLVNGRLYLADWVRIDGGTIYADGHIIKDETSGYDVMLHLDTLICWILTGFMGPSITIDLGFMTLNVCDVVFGLLNPILSAFFPWWPTIDLTNNNLIGDFETYLDIDGIGPDNNVVNPGSLYTRGDFRLVEPGWDAVAFLGNALLGMFLPFLELTPAMDPIRIWNGGAIVAGGKENATSTDPTYVDGNIYVANHRRGDILTYDPENEETSIGFALARGSLMVGGDIIGKYGASGFVDSCSIGAFPLDDNCQAAGIFYSGGIAAGTDPRRSYSRLGAKLSVPFGTYDQELSNQCLSEIDGLWDDPLDSARCWGLDVGGDFLSGNGAYEHNIRGHVFAGQVSALPLTHFRLDQDAAVRNSAVVRQYFKILSGTPQNWAEVDPPNNLPSIMD